MRSDRSDAMTRPAPADFRSRLFVRDFQAVDRLEAFFVSAVSAVLVVRLGLHLTGYPALRGDTLHVAHILWGGLLMLVALVALLSFLGRAAERMGAVLGGIGFGLFVDEIGKIVTRDNDYFYQPAVALIYVVFVVVFLVVHAIHQRREYRPVEYVINALRETEELALHDLDAEERERALAWLERSGVENPLVRALADALSRVEPLPFAGPGWPARARDRARSLYRTLAGLPGFDLALIVLFVGQLVVKLAFGALLIFVVGLGHEEIFDVAFVGRTLERFRELSGLEIAQLAASGLAAVFVALGVTRLARSRVLAYAMFERAILVSILLVQPFSFYREQFAALVELGFNLALLIALRTMRSIEEERAAAAATSATTP